MDKVQQMLSSGFSLQCDLSGGASGGWEHAFTICKVHTLKAKKRQICSPYMLVQINNYLPIAHTDFEKYQL